MGTKIETLCLDCEHTYIARKGGGGFFDLLLCNSCGCPQSVPHDSVPELFRGKMKSHWLQRLANPNERERERFQNLVDTHPDVLPLTGEEYKRAVEASLPHCECGGAFVYDAPIRCPKCRSENHEILKLLSIYD